MLRSGITLHKHSGISQSLQSVIVKTTSQRFGYATISNSAKFPLTNSITELNRSRYWLPAPVNSLSPNQNLTTSLFCAHSPIAKFMLGKTQYNTRAKTSAWQPSFSQYSLEAMTANKAHFFHQFTDNSFFAAALFPIKESSSAFSHLPVVDKQTELAFFHQPRLAQKHFEVAELALHSFGLRYIDGHIAHLRDIAFEASWLKASGLAQRNLLLQIATSLGLLNNPAFALQICNKAILLLEANMLHLEARPFLTLKSQLESRFPISARLPIIKKASITQTREKKQPIDLPSAQTSLDAASELKTKAKRRLTLRKRMSEQIKRDLLQNPSKKAEEDQLSKLEPKPKARSKIKPKFPRAQEQVTPNMPKQDKVAQNSTETTPSKIITQSQVHIVAPPPSAMLKVLESRRAAVYQSDTENDLDDWDGEEELIPLDKKNKAPENTSFLSAKAKIATLLAKGGQNTADTVQRSPSPELAKQSLVKEPALPQPNSTGKLSLEALSKSQPNFTIAAHPRSISPSLLRLGAVAGLKEALRLHSLGLLVVGKVESETEDEENLPPENNQNLSLSPMEGYSNEGYYSDPWLTEWED